jgi:hypothetical protein
MRCDGSDFKMNLLLLIVCPDNLKIYAIYKGQMLEVVLPETGKYTGLGLRRIYAYQCFTRFGQPPLPLENIYQNSLHLIIELKSYNIIANQQMVSHLTELFEKQVAANVKFVVKSQPIGAHVNVVAPFSPVMAAMLDNDRFQEGLCYSVIVSDAKDIRAQPEWKDLVRSYPDLFFEASNRMFNI